MACLSTRKRQKLMRSLLRRMALEVDPEHAYMSSLARELCVEVHTVLRWIKVGRTTYNRATQLRKRFGDKLANVAQLTGTAE